MKTIRLLPGHRLDGARSQRGAVLLISLIILAVLLAAGAAMVRSFDTSLFQAGNLAFKRDLANQAERVTPVVVPLFQAGALSTVAGRAADIPGEAYSATMLPSNAQGIPTALLNANPANARTVPGVPATQGVTVRYLIDRMCMSPGDETTLGDRCIGVDYADAGGSVSGGAVAAPRHVSYRVSVRVDGPRNTQGFFQTVLSVPSP